MSNLQGYASRALEFCGVVGDIKIEFNRITLFNKLRCSYEHFNNTIGKYSYISNNKIYTNLRALYNAGVPYEYIPYNTKDELKDFIVLKINIPMFCWSQIMTHTALSKVSQSDRVCENTEYWLPVDLEERDMKENNMVSYGHCGSYLKAFLGMWDQNTVQEFLKELGYPREIYSRAPYYFRFKTMMIAGWKNDPKTFQHLSLERCTDTSVWKNWTQRETKMICDVIGKVVNKYAKRKV